MKQLLVKCRCVYFNGPHLVERQFYFFAQQSNFDAVEEQAERLFFDANREVTTTDLIMVEITPCGVLNSPEQVIITLEAE